MFLARDSNGKGSGLCSVCNYSTEGPHLWIQMCLASTKGILKLLNKTTSNYMVWRFFLPNIITQDRQHIRPLLGALRLESSNFAISYSLDVKLKAVIINCANFCCHPSISILHCEWNFQDLWYIILECNF